MLIETYRFKQQLKELWNNVFGDSEEYISLLFDYSYTPKECFAYFVEDKIVSVLYLLECEIFHDNKSYCGRYLYAAATDKNYRGQGIMSRLIKEAQDYCKSKSLDFISLVPANDYLYTYYSKFGFTENMHRYVSLKGKNGRLSIHTDEVVSFPEYFRKRREYLKNGFHFGGDETVYASMCLEKGGFKAYRNTENSFYLADTEDGNILEYISSDKDYDANINQFSLKIKDGTKVCSPHIFNESFITHKERFGMVYPINKEVKDLSIYMNIALD